MSVLVGFPNYLNSGNYSGITASSAAASFPVSNLDGTVRRSKVWQSAGNFVVTSSNNVIRFRDASGGADKDATIAVGTYATDALFRAAVDTALEAAGSANYTVTRDTVTNRIQITSDVSGGATHFELRCADAAFTAEDLLGYSATNKTGDTSYIAESLRIHTEEWILIDLGTAFNPKSFGLFGPRNEPVRISSTATVTLQANASDSWTSPAYTATLPYSEFGFFLNSTAGLHSSALRYWRVKIVDVDNSRGYVEASSIFLGQHIALTQGCPQFPLNLDEVDLSEVTQATSGGRFSTSYGKTARLNLDWQFLTKSEIEEFRDLFTEVGIGYPFHVFLDPDEAFSTDLARWSLQVCFDQAPSISLDGPNRFSSSWDLVEDV